MSFYPNARAYLQAVQARYRELDNYSDSGFSRTLGRKGKFNCTFETQYKHPGLFRFAFEMPHPYSGLSHLISKFVIGADGTLPYFYSSHYSDAGSLDYPESLDMTVAGATGISRGTAHTIASLLFDSVTGFSLLDLKRLRFRKHRTIQGVPCVSVSGLHPFAGRFTAWFGAEDMLLRRVYRTKFKSEELRTDPLVDNVFDRKSFQAPSVGADSCVSV